MSPQTNPGLTASKDWNVGLSRRLQILCLQMPEAPPSPPMWLTLPLPKTWPSPSSPQHRPPTPPPNRRPPTPPPDRCPPTPPLDRCPLTPSLDRCPPTPPLDLLHLTPPVTFIQNLHFEKIIRVQSKLIESSESMWSSEHKIEEQRCRWSFRP